LVRQNENEGFTLIELMIVVAIISILASIALPNFLLFQCKSKQTEAKVGLGALFISEKTFLAEQSTYGTDLVTIGWAPEGSPMYLFGFSQNFPAAASMPAGWDGSRNTTLDPSVVGLPGPPRYNTSRTKDLNGGILDPASFPPTVCTGQSFILGAIGDVSPDGGLLLDKWVVDDKRVLTMVRSDCTG
jgi:type IV pilus assembly protein PilA